MANSTTEYSCQAPVLVAVRTCCYAILVLLVLPGNILVVAVTRRLSNLADSTKVLMTSLAASDLLVGCLIVCTVAVSALDGWPFGERACTFAAVLLATFCSLSMGSIVALNIERYVAVTRPYQFPEWCSRRRVITTVLVLSAAALIWGVASTVPIGAEYDPVFAICLVVTDSKVVAALYVSLGVVTPLTIMILVYCRLVRISRQHARRINGGDPNRENAVDERKALVTFLVVTLGFSACLCPFVFSRLVTSLTGMQPPKWLAVVLMALVFGNSALNVFIYCLFNQTFRRVAARIVSETLVRCKSSVVPVDI